MKIELQELVEAVDNINDDIYNQCKFTNERGGEDVSIWIWCEIQYGQNNTVVEFLDQYVYNSNYDEREWIEEETLDNIVVKEAHYEPFEPFLRRKINELIEQLNKIKL